MTSTHFLELMFVAVFIWYLSHQAGRLDRLHHRIEVAGASLDTLLTRRAGIAAELAAIESLDVLSSAMFLDSAHAVLAYDELLSNERLALENELSAVIADTFASRDDVGIVRTDQAGSLLLDELVQVTKRIQLSRRFYADAVSSCLLLRRQRLVRLFRLAGRASSPRTLDFDDNIPEGLRE